MMIGILTVLWTQIRGNLDLLREHRDGGYSTETVVVTAILVALALAVVGVTIYNKVVSKANGITL